MSRDWLADWLDNPIFVKHVRSRLRPQPLASSIVIVAGALPAASPGPDSSSTGS